MNYRHAFHAGNHCDVLKHLALVLALEALARKDKPFAVLDTHAGRGLYDLHSDEAARSAEHESGVARLLGEDAAAPPAAIRGYLEAIAAENPFGGLRWYPGSPRLTLSRLRDGDRLVLCELHPAEREALEAAVGDNARVAIEERDGYEALRARLPFPERRGLVLIDPPFEKPDEFERLARALKDGLRRFATGVFIAWHPLKEPEAVAAFYAAVSGLAPDKALRAELRIAAPAPGRLYGSAVLIINPPFGVSEGLVSALGYVARLLAQTPGAGWRLSEVEKGATILSDGETIAPADDRRAGD